MCAEFGPPSRGQPRAAIIFDLDGVLWDSLEAWERARKRVTRTLGGRFTHELEMQMRQMSAEIWPRFLIDSARLPIDEAELYHLVIQELNTQLASVPVSKASLEAVQCLSNEFTIGIASSAPLSAIESYLRVGHIRSCFTSIVSGDEVSRGKPWPDIYLRCADLLGVPPSSCVAVDDSDAGVRAATAAGMAIIAVGPDDRDARHPLDVDVWVDSVEEIDTQMVVDALRFAALRRPET